MRTRRIHSSSDSMTSEGHRTVLLHEAIELLDIQPTDTVVDATLGGVGHSKEISTRLDSHGTLIGFDLDPHAIERAQHALKEAKHRTILVEDNFRNLEEALRARSVTSISKALFDLGWSGYQLSDGRGFSFLSDEALLMTYHTRTGDLTAHTIVNEWEESSLADVIYGWGEERYARRIAHGIVEARAHKPIATARELAEVVRHAVPHAYARGRIHPATKTFQALRIAVNDELGALEEGMRAAVNLLAPGGRIAIITFHSLEDRIVKHYFTHLEHMGSFHRIAKKPIAPSEEELQANPRARSAKLRVIEKNI